MYDLVGVTPSSLVNVHSVDGLVSVAHVFITHVDAKTERFAIDSSAQCRYYYGYTGVIAAVGTLTNNMYMPQHLTPS